MSDFVEVKSKKVSRPISSWAMEESSDEDEPEQQQQPVEESEESSSQEVCQPRRLHACCSVVCTVLSRMR